MEDFPYKIYTHVRFHATNFVLILCRKFVRVTSRQRARAVLAGQGGRAGLDTSQIFSDEDLYALQSRQRVMEGSADQISSDSLTIQRNMIVVTVFFLISLKVITSTCRGGVSTILPSLTELFFLICVKFKGI